MFNSLYRIPKKVAVFSPNIFVIYLVIIHKTILGIIVIIVINKKITAYLRLNFTSFKILLPYLQCELTTIIQKKNNNKCIQNVCRLNYIDPVSMIFKKFKEHRPKNVIYNMLFCENTMQSLPLIKYCNVSYMKQHISSLSVNL